MTVIIINFILIGKLKGKRVCIKCSLTTPPWSYAYIHACLPFTRLCTTSGVIFRDVRPILSKARLLRRLDKATESNIALVEAKVFERTSSVEMAEEIEDIVQDSRRKPSYLDNEADSGKQTDTKPVEELTQFPF